MLSRWEDALWGRSTNNWFPGGHFAAWCSPLFPQKKGFSGHLQGENPFAHRKSGVTGPERRPVSSLFDDERLALAEIPEPFKWIHHGETAGDLAREISEA